MDEAIIKKIMPHSIDSEKAVIGSMIMDADAIVAASEMLTGDDFYQRQFGILFETMVELYNEGKPVDVLTLQERLKMKDVPEDLPVLNISVSWLIVYRYRRTSGSTRRQWLMMRCCAD